MTAIPQHSSATNEHFTPTDIVERARRLLGGSIDLDPASCSEANETVRASRIFTIAQDGLAQKWNASTVFLNPPGGRLKLIDGRYVPVKGGAAKSSMCVWWDKLTRRPIGFGCCSETLVFVRARRNDRRARRELSMRERGILFSGPMVRRILADAKSETMSRGDHMLALMTTSCDRCGLRGPHVCVSLDRIVDSRPGTGPTFPAPAGGSLRTYNPPGIETIYYAAKRVGLELDVLRSLLIRAGERAPLRRSQWKVKRAVVDRIVAAAAAGEANGR